MNILLCNGKGGTGKTTMAVLLAHALAEAGKRVAVLDLDPQGTARAWLREYDQRQAYASKIAKSVFCYASKVLLTIVVLRVLRVLVQILSSNWFEKFSICDATRFGTL